MDYFKCELDKRRKYKVMSYNRNLNKDDRFI